MLFANPLLRGPLDWRAVATSGYPDTWSPLCWLALRALLAAAGPSPAAFHGASLLVHAGMAAAVFLLARRLLSASRAPQPAARLDAAAMLAALLFAWHPVNAEAVAGAAYLTDIPACLLSLAAVSAYIRWSDSPASSGPYLCWALALLAGLWRWHAALVPAGVVALDAYLRRPARRTAKGIWPLAVIACLVTLAHAWAKRQAGGYGEVVARPGAAARGALHLAGSWLWPGERLPVYLYSGDSPALPLTGTEALLVLAAVTALLVVLRRRWPGALAAWACLLAAVAPPLLFTGPLPTFGHDRYLYLPGAALAIAAGGVWLDVAAGRPRLAAAAALVLLAAGTAGVRALRPWRSSEALWRHAFALDASSPTFAFRLGGALLRESGRGHEAVAYFKLQHRREPEQAAYNLGHAYNRIGLRLAAEGRRREAERALLEALRWDPERPELRANLSAVRGNDILAR